MPLPTSQSYIMLGKESTRGTTVAPTVSLPVKAPAPFDNYRMLEDLGLRGSMGDVYNLIQGVGNQEYACAGDVFPDTFPNLLMGLLGSDTATAAVSKFLDGVTTSGQAAFTSNTAQFTATDVGKAVTGANTGSTTILSVQSPTAATLAVNATGTGTATFTIARTGTNNHLIGLLNNAGSTGNQPPSYTLTDTNGATALTRQIAATQMAELVLKFGAETMFEWTLKAFGNLSTTIANPTSGFTTIIPEAGWMGSWGIAGTQNLKIQSGELSLKRAVVPQFTVQGTQNPYRLFAPQLVVEGKITLIYEDDSDLVRYLTNTQPRVDFAFQQPSTLFQVGGSMAQCAFKVAKVVRSKDYVEVEADLKPILNSTDAVAGGLAPIRFNINNGQSTAY